MPAVVVFEDERCRNLLPLTYWRTTCELRTGYGSLLDHIKAHIAATDAPADGVSGEHLALYCRPEMAAVVAARFTYPVNHPPGPAGALFINGRLLLTTGIEPSPAPAVQWDKDVPLVIFADPPLCERLTPEVLLDPAATKRVLAHLPPHCFIDSPRLVRYPWDLVQVNADMLNHGWKQAGEPAGMQGRACEGVHCLNQGAIHVGAGSTIKPGVVLDAEKGPIYIGENVTISANSSIEGPCFVGEGSLIQPGSNLRDAVSIGQRCKVGGELESSIIHGFSNKQHDGFLGHSYVAEWVNLAADTVNSDLKNTYGSVRVPINGVEVDSGQIFVGLSIGDHSKTGIGQMFPTGAVVGFGCNIATCEFAPKFVPSFTWLTSEETSIYDVERCLEVARRVMGRRQMSMTPAEEARFRALPAVARQIEKRPD